jgi:hypothetical protein
MGTTRDFTPIARKMLFDYECDRVRKMGRIRRWFLARFRLNLAAVCVMSEGEKDYHDYPDWERGLPWHFHKEACIRCGKEFSI